ncbi:hypothetical protein BO78DRAFT_36791 [Aspergillus sclerotiicarbonarius CBS 121057]|uniref:Uncharacterized protein n=1 Tax=Aspergillus sclerotiicarbonarius (strain CBS 121057 / IBT 28362) TaxID=1448318 RepID=A0A319F657_ASPSB|nr:hypothetical protein BO78DRAFT_36791 [Aspergillus sclerotiicarbonarius CBS 121057]
MGDAGSWISIQHQDEETNKQRSRGTLQPNRHSAPWPNRVILVPTVLIGLWHGTRLQPSPSMAWESPFLFWRLSLLIHLHPKQSGSIHFPTYRMQYVWHPPSLQQAQRVIQQYIVLGSPSDRAACNGGHPKGPSSLCDGRPYFSTLLYKSRRGISPSPLR